MMDNEVINSLSLTQSSSQLLNSCTTSHSSISSSTLSSCSSSSSSSCSSSCLSSPSSSSLSSSSSHPYFSSPFPRREFLMLVDLKHKPRGSKGQWHKLEKGQRIRVDKRKGKLLELVLKLPVTESLNLDPDFYRRLQIAIILIDGSNGSGRVSSSTITPEVNVGPSTVISETMEERAILGHFMTQIHLRVRIFSISRRQSFQVALTNHSSIVFTNSSLEFCSDDNGRPYDPHSSISSDRRNSTILPSKHGIKSCIQGIKVEKKESHSSQNSKYM